MKKLTVFEASIIGFFVGIVAAAYITYVASNNGFVGLLLNWISLRPLIGAFSVPQNDILAVSFVFFVAVYTVYGAIVGLLLRNLKRSAVVVFFLILVIAAVIVEQALGTTATLPLSDDNAFQTADVLSAISKISPAQKTPEHYFGTEATGDLNGDGKDDVAFLIHRSDADRGVLYYLSAALAADDGHTGTNLVFLGDDVVPVNISIASGTVVIEYATATSTKAKPAKKTATTTRDFYAHIVDGVLLQAASGASGSTSAQ